MIDAKRLREDTDLVALVERYVELHKAGPEFEGLCPFHTEKTPSFTVVPAKHFYHCFGCGAHGDAIDFVQEMHGVEFKEACEILGGKDTPGWTPPVRASVSTPAAEWVPITPVPRLAPSLFDAEHAAHLYNPKRAGTAKEWTTLRPTAVYEYTDAAGALLGYVLRCEFPDGSKITPQVTFCKSTKDGKDERRWCIAPLPEPRPLYGLQDLANRPDAPVMVVEGEKCKDAAAKLLPSYVVVSAPGGSHGVGHTDWRPLAGRDVVLWPDADAAGRDCMLGWAPNGSQEPRKGVADYLRGQAKRLRWLDPTGQPDGWDVADAAKAGWDGRLIVSWAKEHVGEVPERTARAEPAKVSAEAPVAAPEPTPAAAPVQAPVQPPVQPPVSPPKPRRQTPALSVVGGGSPDGNAARAYEPAEKPVPADQVGLWAFLNLTNNGRGVPYQNLDNAVKTLLKHPDTAGKIWYDSFHTRYYTSWGLPDGKFREWGDGDNLSLAVWFQRDIGLPKISDDLANRAVMTAGQIVKRDAPRDWMETLTWDGTPRIEGSLSRYFGAVENEYIKAAAKNFWISMVARIYQPGCQVDNMIVLESEQGQFKSSALGIIGGDWYAEAHESVTNKDFFMGLHGVMLMEIAELDSFSRAETTKVKQVITCRSDRFRVPYGRVSQNHPRRNIFVGSTNQDAYLMDATGARRFWPVKCGKIDIPGLGEDREQLFAEAVSLYKAGASWWIVPEHEAKQAQESRRSSDAWEDRISDYVESHDFTTINDILEFALEIPLNQADRRIQLRIADALRILGWERTVAKTATKGGWQSKRGWRKKMSDRLPGMDDQ